MLVNLTYLKIKPDEVKEFIAAIHSPKAGETLQKYNVRFTYLLQSKENPEKVISVTGLDSAADLQAVAQSSDYAAIVEGIKPFLTAAPEREVFERIAELEV